MLFVSLFSRQPWFALKCGLAAVLLFSAISAAGAAAPEGLAPEDWRAIRAQLSMPVGRVVKGKVGQEAYFKAHNAGMGDGFGYSVASDGDTVVVGAYYEAEIAGGDGSTNAAAGAGAAYVFVREGSGWIQQAYLKAHNAEAGDEFGVAVAISGNTLVVGAHREAGPAGGDGSANDVGSAGAAYVFVREGISWTQQAYLKAHNAEANDFFGSAVSAHDDTIVIGAYGEAGVAGGDGSTNGATDAGAAYVFVRDGSDWSQQAYLKAQNAEAGDYFAFAVAVSGDTIAVGAYGEDGVAGSDGGANAAEDAGAAYVFTREGDSWTQQVYFKSSATDQYDYFGYSIALAGDTLVVGSLSESGPAGGEGTVVSSSGAAYVFVGDDGGWIQQAYLKAHNAGQFDRFGSSVAIQGDTIVVGAPGEDGSAGGGGTGNSESSSGAAYVFQRESGTWSQRDYLKAHNAESFDLFGASVAVNGTTIQVGAFGEDGVMGGDGSDNEASVAGATYLFSAPTQSSPNLSLSFLGAMDVEPNGGIPFRMQYASVGAAEAVVIEHDVPVGTSFVEGASDDDWLCSPDNQAGSKCTLMLGDLSDGASGQVMLPVQLDYPTPTALLKAGGVLADATISSAHSDADPGDNTDALFVPFEIGLVDVRPTYIETAEDGSTAQFSVALHVAPSTSVTIDFASSHPNEGIPAPTQLTFHSDDFYVRQYVTVTGLDDGVTDGDAPYSVSGTIVPSGSNYDAAVVQTVELLNLALSTGARVLSVDTVNGTGDGQLEPGEVVDVPVTQFVLQFDEPMEAETAEDVANYRVVARGPDGVFQTDGCAELGGDDVSESLSDARYGVDNRHVVVRVGQQRSLQAAAYRLMACDALVGRGTALDGDGNGVPGGDYVHDFAVASSSSFINPNFDLDIEGWNIDGPADFGRGWHPDDAEESPYSGSYLLAGSSVWGTHELTQCLTSTDFRVAALRIRPSANQPLAINLGIEYFAGSNCTGTALGAATAPYVVADTAGDWQWVQVEAGSQLPEAESVRFVLSVEGTTGPEFTVLFDQARTFGAATSFLDGFEEADD